MPLISNLENKIGSQQRPFWVAMFFHPISVFERQKTNGMTSKETAFDFEDGTALTTLLSDKDIDEEGQKNSRHSKRSMPGELVFYGLLLFLYTMAVLAASSRMQRPCPGSTIYSKSISH